MAIGMFLIIGGDYLSRVPRNWSFGIGNRWTLSSDIVWKKTQILAGWLLAADGVAFIAFSIAGLNINIPVISVISVAVALRIYFYRTYTKLTFEGNTK